MHQAHHPSDMEGFVFFTSTYDPQRYRERGPFLHTYALNPVNLILVQAEDDAADIPGGMPLNDATALLHALKRDNPDTDGLFFEDNDEVVLWRFTHLTPLNVVIDL